MHQCGFTKYIIFILILSFKNKCVAILFTSSAIRTYFLIKILLFTSAIPAHSPHSSLSCHISPSLPLLANLFSASKIYSSSISSLFTIHKLCNTMHVATISDIFFKNTSGHFIITLIYPSKYRVPFPHTF